MAGKRTTAESWGVGRGMARIPRLSGRGRAALAPGTVGGRATFPPVVEKKIKKKSVLRFEDWRPSDQKVYISDIGKIDKELKWRPEIGTEEGIERLIDWVRANLDYFR